jgi:hypothetical protein
MAADLIIFTKNFKSLNYLDVAQVTDRTFTFRLIRRVERSANSVAFVAQFSSGVDVEAVLTGFQAVDDTADLDRTVLGRLFDQQFTVHFRALDVDHGPTWTFHRLCSAPADG